jgi:hypothetical protein
MNKIHTQHNDQPEWYQNGEKENDDEKNFDATNHIPNDNDSQVDDPTTDNMSQKPATSVPLH